MALAFGRYAETKLSQLANAIFPMLNASGNDTVTSEEHLSNAWKFIYLASGADKLFKLKQCWNAFLSIIMTLSIFADDKFKQLANAEMPIYSQF